MSEFTEIEGLAGERRRVTVAGLARQEMAWVSDVTWAATKDTAGL